MVRCAHSWAIKLNTQREIPYLRAPMYYSLYIKCTVRFFSKVHFCLVKTLSNSKHSPSWMAPSFLGRHGWNLQIACHTFMSSPQPLFADLVTIFLLTVCLNIFRFFFIVVKHCVVPICTTNKTGHTMQRFPNEANLKRQWVQFVQVNRTDSSSRSNILLFVAVTFLLFVMRKAIWLKWAFLVLSVPTT